MFDGQSAVEVHPRASMDDLKTYTSLSLYMKPPPVKQSELAVTADQFILYLGSKNVRASGFKRWNYIQRKDKCFSLASKKTTCANKQNSHSSTSEGVGQKAKTKVAVPSLCGTGNSSSVGDISWFLHITLTLQTQESECCISKTSRVQRLTVFNAETLLEGI